MIAINRMLQIIMWHAKLVTLYSCDDATVKNEV